MKRPTNLIKKYEKIKLQEKNMYIKAGEKNKQES